MKEVGKTKFDVDNREKYAYLDPLWKVLEDVPSDMKITMREAGKKSGLDPNIGVPLVQEFIMDFEKKMLKNMFSLTRKHDELVDSWTFDKIMLLTQKVDTGTSGMEGIDPELLSYGGPVMQHWIDKWREKRGV